MAGTDQAPKTSIVFPPKPDIVTTEDALRNNFDLGQFDFGNDISLEQKRGYLVTLARTAEAAERYDDMCLCMRHLVVENGVKNPDKLWKDPDNTSAVPEAEIKTSLSVDERNLLSVAYKNVIGARRASWRTLTAETKDENNETLITGYKAAVEKELHLICNNVLGLLQKYLIMTDFEPKTKKKEEPDANETQGDNKQKDTDPEGEAQVFYLKMAGDYFRYLSEAVNDTMNEKKSSDFYKKAFDLSTKVLEPTHPIRLGLALNYSVCFYEILKDKKKACQLAKDAFDEAISKLDKLEEADYKDSTLIMQLLRDNLTLWTSSDEADDPKKNQDDDIDDGEQGCVGGGD